MEDVLIPGFVFATPVLIVWIAMLFQWKNEQARTQLIGKALELGKEIDPALLVRPVKQKKQNANRLLAWGITLVSLGLAVFGSVLLLTDLRWASLSSLLSFPGIGLLIVHVLTRKSKTARIGE
ncbi:MAG: DUF6249 domain-containing protein [Prevotellaceae bacterium]|jgi:hypothetical protein|nr:DUF6249 domain-containing protein [Prevotellaceae bacterium]